LFVLVRGPVVIALDNEHSPLPSQLPDCRSLPVLKAGILSGVTPLSLLLWRKRPETFVRVRFERR
jgi:hypothetical protein